MDNNTFKVLETTEPPPSPDLLDAILGGVQDATPAPSFAVVAPTLIEELEGLEDIGKIMPLIGKLLALEIESKGKRVYPKRILRQQHIVAYMLLNPFATTTELCNFFGMSPSTFYNISRSDTFRALAQSHQIRLNADFDIQQQLKETLSVAIEVTQRAIVEQQDPDYALAVLDKTANRLGLGAKQGTNVQINNNVVTPDMIAYARQKRLSNG